MAKNNGLFFRPTRQEVNAGKPSQAAVGVYEFQLDIGVRQSDLLPAEGPCRRSLSGNHWDAQRSGDGFGQDRVVRACIHQRQEIPRSVRAMNSDLDFRSEDDDGVSRIG